jgi:hypothetical protein
MKHLLLFVGWFGLVILARGSDGDSGCGPVALQANVAVKSGIFSLADLLPPSACPALRSALRLPLGRAPSAGSPRIFTGEEIRTLFMQNSKSAANPSLALGALQVPERVTVQLAGTRASCADIAGSIPRSPARQGQVEFAAANLTQSANCGAQGRIPQDAPIAAVKTAWNPGLRSWEITARCIHPADCVPFLLSTRADALPDNRSPVAPPTEEPPLVRPGQSMTLLWDQDGIRVVLRVTCLDRGRVGETVRAQVLQSNRVLRATVINPETLRIQL